MQCVWRLCLGVSSYQTASGVVDDINHRIVWSTLDWLQAAVIAGIMWPHPRTKRKGYENLTPDWSEWPNATNRTVRGLPLQTCPGVYIGIVDYLLTKEINNSTFFGGSLSDCLASVIKSCFSDRSNRNYDLTLICQVLWSIYAFLVLSDARDANTRGSLGCRRFSGRFPPVSLKK